MTSARDTGQKAPAWTAPRLERLGTMQDVAGGKKASGEIGPGSSPDKS